MGRYILRRLFFLVGTLIVTSIIIFALTQFLPGDVARLILGREASPETLAQFNERFGLDQPLVNQYINWFTGFITGEWGTSFSAGNPKVFAQVIDKLGNSLVLAGFTLLIAMPISVLLGIVAAVRENTWVDSVISVVSLSVVGLPEFVTGVILINIFALGFGWFAATTPPFSELTSLGDWLSVLILPAITASFVLIGYVTRMTRAGVIDELKKDYVRTAKLKGLSPRQIMMRHVLRNALLPTITVIAISIGWLIGGLVVIEQVFNYKGLGSLLVDAVKQKNLPVLQAVSMIVVFTFAFSNLVADLLYALLNPRIRLS
jgi:peptide/nickel transport system permease protein